MLGEGSPMSLGRGVTLVQGVQGVLLPEGLQDLSEGGLQELDLFLLDTVGQDPHHLLGLRVLAESLPATVLRERGLLVLRLPSALAAHPPALALAPLHPAVFLGQDLVLATPLLVIQDHATQAQQDQDHRGRFLARHEVRPQ